MVASFMLALVYVMDWCIICKTVSQILDKLFLKIFMDVQRRVVQIELAPYRFYLISFDLRLLSKF